jgi:hypothetical protein
MDAVEGGNIKVNGDTLLAFLYPPGYPKLDNAEAEPDLEDGLFLGDMVLRVRFHYTYVTGD